MGPSILKVIQLLSQDEFEKSTKLVFVNELKDQSGLQKEDGFYVVNILVPFLFCHVSWYFVEWWPLFLPCFPNPQVTVPGSVGYLIMANTAKGPVSSKKCDWMSRTGSERINGLFHLLISGVYFECGPLTVRVTTKIITFLGSGIPT